MKKDSKNLFDVTMGSFDGAEICELVGIFILNTLAEKYDKNNIGLYRDDGLAIFRNTPGKQLDRIRKGLIKTFKEIGLKITIQVNLKTTNFLDVTLNLGNGRFYPYRKPNDRPVYIYKDSNHPPNMTKNLPASISRRISNITHDAEIFRNAAPFYEDALKESGYTERMVCRDKQPTNKKRNRKRNTIWFNPPFSKNIATNIGTTFLKLISKHFPPRSKLHKIFNKNTVKISYSCMPNMQSILRAHNEAELAAKPSEEERKCNCSKKGSCPLQNECLTKNVVYKATVS